MSFRFLALALLAALVAMARAQSFNIDLDVGSPPEGGGGAPSTSFGAAAGQTGFWNAVDAPGPVVPLTLKDLNGTLTSATLLETGGVAMSHAIAFAPNTGDYARLLNDFASMGESGNSFYTFNHMLPGDYVIYTYAVTPFIRSGLVHVQVTGAEEGIVDVTGPMPGNAFEAGITHSVHHVHLTGTSMTISLSSTSNLAAVNGFQVVAVPEPLTCATLGLGCMWAVMRSKRNRFQK